MIRLHALLPRSRANGPGERFVVWFQGCSLGCPGCCNPETHEPNGSPSSVPALVDRIIASSHRLEGVTLSGGEPFEQPEALLALVRSVRERLAHLSIIVF